MTHLYLTVSDFLNSIFYPIQYYKRFCQNYLTYSWVDSSIILMSLFANSEPIIKKDGSIKLYNFFLNFKFSGLDLCTFQNYALYPRSINGFIFLKNLRQHAYIYDIFLCILYYIYYIHCVLFILRIQFFSINRWWRMGIVNQERQV